MLVKYEGIGMSACQVGIPVRMSVIQFTPAQLNTWSAEDIKERDMEVIPLTVLINPKIRIVDKSVVTFREGCCSLYGLTAEVPRAKEVSVTYLNEKGDLVENVVVRDWTARIVQHEMDHLDGQLFTDCMKNETLELTYWKAVNDKRGEFKTWFGGIRNWKNRIEDMMPFGIKVF